MKRRSDLERLAELRELRLDRAVRAISVQNAAIVQADARLAAATAAAVANADRRDAREGELIGRLAMRPLTAREIGRAHDTLENLEQEARELDCGEQEAVRALEGERGKLAELGAERLRLERERDKLRTVAAAQAKTAFRRAEMLAELDADGDARPSRGFGGGKR